ncbi:MAG: class I SAM-dependent methyltransferase [Verrucomicrobiota bacterium]|nr:class I SAM-dependent methyltransferase [Limisphaera sp.]MDW8382833.1 class I SAM-dependent methyltransferase [Verrucomicrobiota bacterium]
MRICRSKYVDRVGRDNSPTGRLRTHLAEARAERLLAEAAVDDRAWLDQLRQDFPRVVAHLQRGWRLKFRGRILEIGAGACALSAELSKLPQVVEIVATDVSRRLLQELAPRVFLHLEARCDKIVRMPADYYHLEFPNSHFDFVVCSATLHEAIDVTAVLREVKRVLKPGGKMVAVREPRPPWWPNSWRWNRSEDPAPRRRPYSLAEYRAFFAAAGLQLMARRFWPDGGLREYFNEVWEGLGRDTYVLVAVRPPSPTHSRFGTDVVTLLQRS